MESIKPLQKCQRVPILQQIKGISFTKSADEALFCLAEISSEGAVEADESGEAVYYGSSLLAFDLDCDQLNGAQVVEDRGIIEELARRSVLLRIRLMRLARAEAERRVAPCLIREMTTHTEFKIADRQLLVDINIECSLAVPAVGGDQMSEGRG